MKTRVRPVSLRPDEPKKTRVLYILEATVGGTKKHLLQLLRGMSRERYEFSLVCSSLRLPSFEPEISQLRAEGIPVEVIEMRREISPLSDFQAFLSIWLHLWSHTYDIVHTHSTKAGILGRLAARLADVPFIVHSPHGFSFLQQLPRWKLKVFELLERAAGRLTSMTVAISKYEMKLALNSHICPRGRVRFIENGLSRAEMTLPRTRRKTRQQLGVGTNELLIASVGRLSPQKAHRFLVQAALLLQEQFPQAKFAIAGMGPELLRLERLVIHHRLGTFLKILGECHDMPSLYAATDIFVLPSLWEGMPYALMEAMAYGRPVVVSNVCGLDDVIEDGKNGLLFDAGNVDSLVECIRRLLESASLRKRLGRAARTLARKRFKLSRMLDELDAVYRQSPLPGSVSPGRVTRRMAAPRPRTAMEWLIATPPKRPRRIKPLLSEP